MNPLSRWRTRLAIAVAWLAMQTTAVQACPNCKFALEADASPQPRAYMLSIIFMLAVIMSLFGAMFGLLWWLSKQECRALTDAGYDHVLHNAVPQR